MDEIPGDPKDMGIPIEDLQTDRGREQIGNIFEEQIDKLKRDLWGEKSAKNAELLGLDKTKLFAKFRGVHGSEDDRGG